MILSKWALRKCKEAGLTTEQIKEINDFYKKQIEKSIALFKVEEFQKPTQDKPA